ncbi:MAG: NADPH:quinone reductase [Gemmatimonadetes bacterium]|nr:NADPH:quinone reductase [Gemmatimonadota bacterium]
MKAAWYESQGPAESVLVVGDLPDPHPGDGEVRIRVQASGINPGDVKKRSDEFGVGMPYARVIPHSDGSGVIDSMGSGVSDLTVGDRVWCFGAQSYRPFGTAAEYVVVPATSVARLPDGVDFEQGACLGIPGITAHRAVHSAGPPAGKCVMIQGGAGAVGLASVALARFAGARVVATTRGAAQEAKAESAGAHAVIRTDAISPEDLLASIRQVAPDGVDHVVEVAFDANLVLDEQVLRQGGSIATYATGDPYPVIPFWPLVFKNVSIFFLGSDDFTAQQQQEAATHLSGALAASWPGYPIGARYPLRDVAIAHKAVEDRSVRGRIVLDLSEGAF